MRRWAPRWWRSSESTCRGSATLSPSSAPLLSRQDKQHLSSSCQSRRRETLASGFYSNKVLADWFSSLFPSWKHLGIKTAATMFVLTELCPRLLSREQRWLERSQWAAAARPRLRRPTEAAGWYGTKMMTFQVRGNDTSKDWRNIVPHKTLNWLSTCVCCSIRWRRTPPQQHPAGVGEVHHGAAGGAVLLPRLPASGPGHQYHQLISIQVRRPIQDHSCEQTLFPLPKVHRSQAGYQNSL